MPFKKTDPYAGFIAREITDPETAETIKLYADALDEMVNKGTHISGWCSFNEDLQPPKYPVITYFRQILELLDATSVLIRAGAAPPCLIVLRSLIETVLGFEYLLKEDSDRRGRCYNFYEQLRLLEHYKKHHPAHQHY